MASERARLTCHFALLGWRQSNHRVSHHDVVNIGNGCQSSYIDDAIVILPNPNWVIHSQPFVDRCFVTMFMFQSWSKIWSSC